MNPFTDFGVLTIRTGTFATSSTDYLPHEISPFTVYHAQLLRKFQNLVVTKLGEPVPPEPNQDYSAASHLWNEGNWLQMRNILGITNSFVIGEFQGFRPRPVQFPQNRQHLKQADFVH